MTLPTLVPAYLQNRVGKQHRFSGEHYTVVFFALGFIADAVNGLE